MGDIGVTGDDPLVDGQRIALRLRRDFMVTDAQRFLAAARQAYVELHPDATVEDAAAMVTCAADAVYTMLERDGLLGDDADARLAAYAAEGLEVGGYRAELTFNDPWPLRAGYDCVERDVFALPTGDHGG